MKLEAQILFYDGVQINVYRTQDKHLIETAVYSGKDYQKTLISVTNQIGCPIRCDFCKVSEGSFIRDITVEEYLLQVAGTIDNTDTPWHHPIKPVKVSLTRAGEPLLNKHAVDGIVNIGDKYNPSFQITSVMPNKPISQQLLNQLMAYASRYPQTFQLNVSMHTSDEAARTKMMGNYSGLMSFKEIATVGEEWVRAFPEKTRRKANLSFALMEDNVVDLRCIKELFDPQYFAIRFAFFLPSSRQTAEKYRPSGEERMRQKAKEARDLGYLCIESRAGPIELRWDTRPWSAFKMLRDT